jgi:hypothetical protein
VTRPTYTLTLEPTWPGDPDRQLARLLKAALRQHGFRCRQVAQVESDVETAAPAEEPR